MRGSMKKRNKKTAKILAAVLAAALGVCVPETTLQAAETQTSVQIQMPGFVVEQFSAPRLIRDGRKYRLGMGADQYRLVFCTGWQSDWLRPL